ncbi:MAG TPA: GNAT family N-acetyltransferase [Rhizomicrobium sp.]|jgi:predicted GNAT family N-acyltransferase|nr:GNAT family N-acetyltransferase [Rhizomicrobium sp.]
MDIKIQVVTTPDALAQAFAIRAVVYMGEQQCPYNEEFDGNDYSATQIIAYLDGEPAGTARVRWFGTFAKYERVAVLPRFRKTPVTKQLIEFCFELQRRKGFNTGYAHSMKALVPHWGAFGWHPRDPGKVFVFSDHEYVEIVGQLEPHPHAVKLGGNPYETIRVEGSWDEPGILEESAARPATNIHGGKIS